MRDFLREPNTWVVASLAIVAALLDLSHYSSGDFRPHQTIFYQTFSGDYRLTTEEGLNNYFPTYLLLTSPAMALGHLLGDWNLQVLLLKILESFSFVMSSLLIAHRLPPRYRLLALLYVFLQVQYQYTANGGRFECTVLMFFLLGWLLLEKKKNLLAGVAWGLGSFKLYTFPALLTFAFMHWSKRSWRDCELPLVGFFAVQIPAFGLILFCPDVGVYLSSLLGRYKTHHSGHLHQHHVLSFLEESAPAIANFYCEQGVWKWFIPLFLCLAWWGHKKKRFSCADALLVSMVPIAFLWQGETKILFFYVLFLLSIAPRLDLSYALPCLIFASVSVYAPRHLIHLEDYIRHPEGSALLNLFGMKYWFLFAFGVHLYVIWRKPQREKLSGTPASPTV